jgi:hypothetical protein
VYLFVTSNEHILMLRLLRNCLSLAISRVNMCCFIKAESWAANVNAGAFFQFITSRVNIGVLCVLIKARTLGGNRTDVTVLCLYTG